ncbi:MAG: class I SAM-dependent methyltransferase [SAR324 cluster bacterium]|nr:class I SAM-dependent methyltransferase [SAR324 cluster bacterium]
MTDKKFNPKHIEKLNNPGRKEIHNPALIWETLGLKDPQVLVDVGAGTGFFALPFADKMPKGIVYACDSSDTMMDWLKENLPREYDGRVIPLKTEENSIGLDDQIADLVFMMMLHHELDSPLQMLQEVKRLLKPGGKVMIVDWAKKEIPFGPPMEIRVAAEIIQKQLLQTGFNNIVQHEVLPFNSFLVATKPDQ